MAAGLMGEAETIMLPTIIDGQNNMLKTIKTYQDAKATLTIDAVLPLKDITVE